MELIRSLTKLCTNKDDALPAAHELLKRFTTIGVPKSVTTSWIRRAFYTERLNTRRNASGVLVLRYHPAFAFTDFGLRLRNFLKDPIWPSALHSAKIPWVSDITIGWRNHDAHLSLRLRHDRR